MKGYGQYCPLALAAELLCERWTLLIVSRLIDGCTQFNEIQRGVPRISPSLLSQRLAQLEHAGLIVREPARRGSVRKYMLTPAGGDLAPIIESLAVWGQHWSRDMTREDLDPAFLVWSMHMRMDTTQMPDRRIVIEFQFTGAPREPRRFWLVSQDGTVDMCLKNPGYDVDIKVTADLRLFIEAWRGIRDLRQEITADRIRLIGAPSLCRQFHRWLKLSLLAPYARRRAGHEQRTQRGCAPQSKRASTRTALSSAANGLSTAASS